MGQRAAIGAVAFTLLAGCADAGDPAPLATPSATPPSPVEAVDVTDADTCEDLAVRVVDALQAYVDTFADVPAAEIGDVALDTGERLDTIAEDAGDRARELGCASDELGDLLREEVARLQGGGPVAEAVAGTLVADLLGTIDPSDPGPSTVEVASVTELATALGNVGSGSTIRITTERLRIEQPLLLLRPITLVGAGQDATVIESTAEGAAIIALTDGTLRLEDLTVRHIGDEPASVLVVRRGGYDLEDVTLADGVVDEGGAGGFGLILRQELPGPTAPIDRRIVRTTVVGNAGGGIVVAGDEAPTIEDVTIRGEGLCGLCFDARAGGTIRSVEVEGHLAGVRVDGASEPDIAGLQVTDAQVGIALTGTGASRIADGEVTGSRSGVEISGSGAPSIESTRVVDSADVGVRISAGTPTWIGGEITGETPVGIAVVGGAPDFVDVLVTTSGDVGIVHAEVAAGTVRGATVTGSRLGLQVGGTSSPTITDVDLEALEEAAVVVTDEATPTLDALRCDGTETGIVALLEAADPDLGDDLDCEVVDQRE